LDGGGFGAVRKFAASPLRVRAAPPRCRRHQAAAAGELPAAAEGGEPANPRTVNREVGLAVQGGLFVHPDLEEAVAFHEAVLAEGSKALVGYDVPKQLANVVLLSEIPTTYDKKEQRQVSSGNLLLRGVPGVGKTFFGVILAAISDAKFARLQGRADLQPTEVVGFQMINPATGELITEFGPLAEAEIILLDEINRIPLKSQSAFLEGLQDRTVTVGKTTYELPAFSFAIATMNPVELGQGTFPLSEAATDRFAIIVNIGYLPPEEERKLVNFDFKRMRLKPLMGKERIIQLRAAINQHVFLHDVLGDYIQRLVAATRPFNPEIEWHSHSPSDLVERGVDLGASPRAIICWGRLAKAWAALVRRRDEVYPEDIQDLAPYILGHRIWLGPHAASHGLTTEAVIADVVQRVPIP
jgi:MoxR-like ATPase